MPNISFDLLYEYDPGKPGITIPVELKSGQQSVKASAKLDTGSTFCIFKREIGEQLGFDIEAGVEELISSVTGSFTAYGHPLTLETFELRIRDYEQNSPAPSFTHNVGRREFANPASRAC